MIRTPSALDKEKAAQTAALRAHRGGFVAGDDHLAVQRELIPPLESVRGYLVSGIIA